jgi:hypothetical protein
MLESGAASLEQLDEIRRNGKQHESNSAHARTRAVRRGIAAHYNRRSRF